MTFVVQALVITDDPGHATKAAEVMARAAAGLLLDGIDVRIDLSTAEECDDPEHDHSD